jgi:hypothetical protein
MKSKKNYYIQVAIQVESDVEAMEMAAKLAETSQEYAYLHQCGTQRKICIISKDGDILMSKEAKTL